MNKITIKLHNIDRLCDQSTCFEADLSVQRLIGKMKPIQGTIEIDARKYLFYFSPYAMDGNIFNSYQTPKVPITNIARIQNSSDRTMIKHFLPIYVLANF